MTYYLPSIHKTNYFNNNILDNIINTYYNLYITESIVDNFILKLTELQEFAKKNKSEKYPALDKSIDKSIDLKLFVLYSTNAYKNNTIFTKEILDEIKANFWSDKMILDITYKLKNSKIIEVEKHIIDSMNYPYMKNYIYIYLDILNNHIDTDELIAYIGINNYNRLIKFFNDLYVIYQNILYPRKSVNIVNYDLSSFNIENDILRFYVYKGDRIINLAIRENKATKLAQESIDSLITLINNGSKFKEPICLYRGIDENLSRVLDEIKINSTVFFSGFQSQTYDYKSALNFAKNGILLKICYPIDMPFISFNPLEKEVLTYPNSEYIITDKYVNDDAIITIELKYHQNKEINIVINDYENFDYYFIKFYQYLEKYKLSIEQIFIWYSNYFNLLLKYKELKYLVDTYLGGITKYEITNYMTYYENYFNKLSIKDYNITLNDLKNLDPEIYIIYYAIPYYIKAEKNEINQFIIDNKLLDDFKF